MTRVSFFFKIIIFFVFYLLCLLCLSKILWAGNLSENFNETAVISNVLVEISPEFKNQKSLSKMAQNLIYIKPGEIFDDQRFNDSIEALKVCNQFSRINVDSQKTPHGLIIKFTLVPFHYIKKINISGAYPLFEQQILNTMTVYTGDTYVENKINQQVSLIESLFKQEGFLSPDVNIDSWMDPSDQNYILKIYISKGDYLSLENLTFSGNTAFSDSRLKLHMKTWRRSLLPGSAGRFIERDLKQDIERLTQFYRKQHFADVKIDSSVTKDLENQKISVVVDIIEGELYQIEFAGNDAFWDLTLQKDLVIFKDGNLHGLGLRKSARKIKERYYQAGYLETRIDIDKNNDQQPVRNIKFIISEGPFSQVTSVEIKGNTMIFDQDIKDQMLIRPPESFHSGAYVPEILETDINAIKTFYAIKGYPDTEIKSRVHFSEDKETVNIQIDIDEGVRTLVGSVRLTGIDGDLLEQAQKTIKLKPDMPFRQHMLKSDENSVQALISPEGYPHVKVRSDVVFSDDRTQADIVYDVKKGPFVEMGPVYVSGNFRTKEYIVSREIPLKSQDPFSLQQMLEGQQAVRNLDIFDSVKFKTIGLKEKAEDINLFVEVEEKKPYYVQFGLGYRTDMGGYANAKAGDRNFLGRNKEIWVGGSVSEIGHRLEGWLTEPRLLGTLFQTEFGIFNEKKEEFNQDFGITTTGAVLGFNRKWLEDQLITALSFRYEKREQFHADKFDPEKIDNDEFRPRNLLVATPSISYDTRDSVIRPRNGFFSMALADISKGLENDLDSFVKYQGDVRCYWTSETASWLTLAWLGRIGFIDPFGGIDEVPDDQLFYLGGTSDVRGYDENMMIFDADDDPVGGKLSMVSSLEARIDLQHNFEFTLFFDAGRLSETPEEARFDDIRTSAGLGLRYITPIGPIGLLYGFKLDKKESESSGRFHFSIGYTF